MKNLSKSEKILITALLVIIVAYVYFQYLIIPVSNNINTSKSNIEKYNSEVLQARIVSASNKKLTEDIKLLKKKQEEYKKVLPNTDRAAEVIRDLKKIGDNNKLIINNLTLGAVSEFNAAQDNTQKADGKKNSTTNTNPINSSQTSSVKPMMLPVTISVTGDYNGIMNFVKSIEEGTRVIEVSSVNMFSEGIDKVTPLKAIMNVNILFMEDGTANKNQYDFNNGIYGKEDLFK